MTIPGFQKFMLPVLQVIADGKSEIGVNKLGSTLFFNKKSKN